MFTDNEIKYGIVFHLSAVEQFALSPESDGLDIEAEGSTEQVRLYLDQTQVARLRGWLNAVFPSAAQAEPAAEVATLNAALTEVRQKLQARNEEVLSLAAEVEKLRAENDSLKALAVCETCEASDEDWTVPRFCQTCWNAAVEAKLQAERERDELKVQVAAKDKALQHIYDLLSLGTRTHPTEDGHCVICNVLALAERDLNSKP